MIRICSPHRSGSKTVTHHGSRSAFTLIELLVVIAIIALLAAILFPVFARARENARRSSCQSNLKQIGIGVMQYVQDNDERYPMLWSYATVGSQANVFWTNSLQPYMKSVQVFTCPSQPKTGQTLLTADGWTAKDNANYIMNIAIITRGFGLVPVHQSKIEKSDDVFLLWDGDAGNNGNNFQSDYTSPGNVDALRPGLVGPSSIPTPKSQRGLHLEGENYAYCDGHVKWYNRSSVVWDSVGAQPSPATDPRFYVH